MSIMVITLTFLLMIHGIKREVIIDFSYLAFTELTGLIVLALLFCKSHHRNKMAKKIIKTGWFVQNAVKTLLPWLLEHYQIIEKQSEIDPMHIYML